MIAEAEKSVNWEQVEIFSRLGGEGPLEQEQRIERRTDKFGNVRYIQTGEIVRMTARGQAVQPLTMELRAASVEEAFRAGVKAVEAMIAEMNKQIIVPHTQVKLDKNRLRNG